MNRLYFLTFFVALAFTSNPVYSQEIVHEDVTRIKLESGQWVIDTEYHPEAGMSQPPTTELSSVIRDGDRGIQHQVKSKSDWSCKSLTYFKDPVVFWRPDLSALVFKFGVVTGDGPRNYSYRAKHLNKWGLPSGTGFYGNVTIGQVNYEEDHYFVVPANSSGCSNFTDWQIRFYLDGCFETPHILTFKKSLVTCR